MIIFFDTETTGLTPGNIIQLSYVTEEKAETKAKNFFFYVPFIPPQSTAIHGITVEKLAKLSGGHTFSEYLEEIDDDFRRADLTVAHNFAFDYKFMSAEFSYFDRIFHYKESFDTMKKFTPLVKLPRIGGVGYKYPKLTELTEFFDIYPYDVSRLSISFFGDAGAAHDSRYDSTATYMSFMAAANMLPDIAKILDEYS